ncbi:hypothetical protein CROQUDRAFT_668089 [Cronartium quercuum f. sp. fusiforme G11]|uniref:Uncharacterized protein n=1 Tax=Cronartium quercuum f. sp. fusiforme G11 TaxID=708437 RepID=A0A9P6TGQ5_9BASI|nr:hypothetical protein CROQUDRAFT_668089 [Cronartium quercuum f. sp. fusiforme G11]
MSITSLPISTTTTLTINRNLLNSGRPTHLITIPDSATSVSCPSSASSSDPSPHCSSRLESRESRESGTGHKRRRIQTRLGPSSSFCLPTPPPSPNTLHSSPQAAAKNTRNPSPVEPDDDSCLLDDDSDIFPVSRLDLTRANFPAPPRPPRLPFDDPINPLHPCLYSASTFKPYILPSISFPDTDVGTSISTCLRSSLDPFSVSISSQPPLSYAKPTSRTLRPRKPNTQRSGSSTPVPPIKPEELEQERERSRDLEQNKSWNWANTCPATAEANKSALASPLRCLDLAQDPFEGIITKPAVVCHLDDDIIHPVDGSKWRVKSCF